MNLFKVFRVCIVVAGLLSSCSLPVFSEGIFKDRSAEKNPRVLIKLNRIEKKIKVDFPKTDPGIVDFLFSNTNEVFLRTEDGLFYACEKPSNLVVNQIFARTLAQIEPLFSFSTKDGKFIIFKHEEMKNGIITDWYSFLRIKPGVHFRREDYGQIQGFDRDSEDGENGINESEEVIDVKATDFNQDGNQDILFSIKKTHYINKTTEEEIRVFTFSNDEFNELVNVPGEAKKH